MSCFILPTSPFFKLAFLPRVVIGYPQGYPTPTAAPPPPTITTAAPPRFIRQPLPPNTCVATQVATGGYPAPGAAAPPAIDARTLVAPPVRGDFRSAFPPGAAAVAAAAFLGTPGYPKSAFRTGGGGYHRAGPIVSPGGGTGKGIKRKSDELLSAGTPSPSSSVDGGSGSADGDTGSKGDSASSALLQPLYCKVCRVTLNAPAQAKQHYEGKNHSKKMRLYDDDDDKDKGSGSEGNGSSDQPSTPSGGTSPTTTEIHPEVYCRTCGVSFNSPKQAQQHYQGKNHAKKTRASQQQEKQTAASQGADSLTNKYGSKFNCDACNIHVTSQEQLDSHLKGARHAARGRPERPVLPSVRHRWKHVALPQFRPDKILHHSLTPAFCQTF